MKTMQNSILYGLFGLLTFQTLVFADEAIQNVEDRVTPNGIRLAYSAPDCFFGPQIRCAQPFPLKDWQKYDIQSLDGTVGLCTEQFDYPTNATWHGNTKQGFKSFSGICYTEEATRFLIESVDHQYRYLDIHFSGEKSFFKGYNGCIGKFNKGDEIEQNFANFTITAETKEPNPILLYTCETKESTNKTSDGQMHYEIIQTTL